jgi:hypothetical protein
VTGRFNRPSARRAGTLAAAALTAVIAVLAANAQPAAASTTSLAKTTYGNCRASSDMYARFSDSINYGYWSATVSGSSRVAWLGSTPYNAQEIRYEDKFEYLPSGYASVSGTGWTVSSGNAYWRHTRYNDWDYDHYYNGVNASGLITHVRRATTASFIFADRGCTVQAANTRWLT